MKNISSVLLVLFMAVSFVGFGQKVKVKKGKIFVDGTEVGIIEALDKKAIKYAVKDLSGVELFLVDVDIAEGSTRPFEFNWMTVSSEDFPQVNVVDYSMLSMSLSHPKIIAEIFTKTYGVFSINGLDREKVAEFFSIQRTSKYKDEVISVEAEEPAEKREEIKYVIKEERRGSLGSDIKKAIISSFDGEIKYGTVEYLKSVVPTNSKFYIKVLDNDNQRIAMFTPDSENNAFSLKGYNKINVKSSLEGDTQFLKSKLFNSILSELVANGLENGIVYGVLKGREQDIEDYYRLNKEAGNILNESGYMLSSSGEKLQGFVTLYFKSIALPLGVEDLELKYPTAKVNGRKMGLEFRFTRVEGAAGSTYKSRDNRGFCVYLENGGDKCFVGKKLGTAEYGFVETDALQPGN